MRSSTNGLKPDSATVATVMLSGFVVAAAVIFSALAVNPIDFSHMYFPVEAFISKNWESIYPEGTFATSFTGWLLLSGGPTYVLSFFTTTVNAYTLTNLMFLPALALGVKYTATAFWGERKVVWLLAAVSVWPPTTLAAYANAYHPQDLAATTLVVWALGLIAGKHYGVAGIVFGFAVLTRQWALLAFLPAAGFTGKHWFKFGGFFVVTSCLLVAPIVFLEGNESWFGVLSGGSVWPKEDTFAGMLSMSYGYEKSIPLGVFLFSRVLPVFLAAGIGFWAHRKQLPVAFIVPAVVTGLAFRMVFDVAHFLYYWVPFAVLLLLLFPKIKTVWVGVALWGFLPWVLDVVAPAASTTLLPYGSVYTPNTVVDVARAAVMFMLSVTLIGFCFYLYKKLWEGGVSGESVASSGRRGAALLLVAPSLAAILCMGALVEKGSFVVDPNERVDVVFSRPQSP